MIDYKLIKELRIKNNYTQSKLSSLLGVSRSAVSMWEIGSSEPDTEAISKMADLFGVSTDYLLGRKEYTSSNNPQLTEDEENLIQAYRNHPEMQAAVNKMLDIDDDLETLIKIKQSKPNRETTRYATIAAKGHGLHKIEVTEEQHKAAVEALHELENKK